MITPYVLSARSLRQLLLTCACLSAVGAHAPGQAQTTADAPGKEVAPGVELYRRGDYEGAVKSLKRAVGKSKDDADAWRFLGLAYEKSGKPKDARKALEKAVAVSFRRLIPKPVPGEDYEKLSPEERAARRLQLVPHFRRAAEVVENYLTLNPDGAAFWRAQLESLRFYAEHTAQPASRASVFFPTELDHKAQISSRPEPLYTEEARSRGISGDMMLRLVLASDGTVQHILVLESLPHGLTEQAIAAARAIKFTPATKDARPVSQFVTIQYHFKVY